MGFLTAQQILEVNDMPEAQVVNVPEWGGDVLVRPMTAGERDLYEQDIMASQAEGIVPNVRARLVSYVAVDEQGNRLFSAEDIEALSKKNATAIDRVFSKARSMNVISKADIEELEKNLESDHNDNSSSS